MNRKQPQSLQQNTRLTPNVGMIRMVDDYVIGLLRETAADTLEKRLETLTTVTKWIGVRHKLIDSEDTHGAGLSEYRAKIAAKDSAGRNDAGKRRDNEPATAAVGADLAAFRSQLPDAGVGDVLDARSTAGRKVHSAAGGNGRLHPGIPRDAGAGADDDPNDSDL